MEKKQIRKHINENDCVNILKNLPVVVMLTDLDGNIIYCNREGENTLGYEIEEMKGKKLWSLYSNRGEEEFERDREKLEWGESVSFEALAQTKYGEPKWLDIRRRLLKNSEGEYYILGTASDISKQKEAELELKENKVRTEAILETAAEGIITIKMDGTILSFNRAAEQMFGYPDEEIIGKCLCILMPSLYWENYNDYLNNYRKNGDKNLIGNAREIRGRRKDGAVFPIEISINEVVLEDEVIFTGLIKDISDRRKLENEVLKISEDERRHLGHELHDDLGQMLSGIGLITRNLARKFEAQGIPEAEELSEIANMIKVADEQTRNLAHGHALIDLEQEGLKVAINRLCRRYREIVDIRCKGDFPEEVDEDSNNHSLHIYRIVQEAINNAINHGKPENIVVRFKNKPRLMELVIEDNGNGFDDTGEMNKGMGIKTMKYRANIMGGNLNIERTSYEWTRVVCHIPSGN